MITIDIKEPLYGVNNTTTVDTLQDPMGYNHVISTFLGYDWSIFSFNTSQLNADNWMVSGLGRDIKVISDTQIFEGFADTVTATIGNTIVTRGPMLGVANRVKVAYTPIDTSTSSYPIYGTLNFTSEANDTDSQEKYGVRSKLIIASNALSFSDADNIRDNYLERHKNPAKNETVGMSGDSNTVKITLTVKGYAHWLDYPYTLDIANSTISVSDKIANILLSEPNSAFTNTLGIETNTTLQTAWEANNNSGLSLIKGMLAIGDSSQTRHTFGVFNNRIAKYQQAETEVFYQKSISSKSTDVRFVQGGAVVPPQFIVPGKWLMYSDILSSGTIPSGSYSLLDNSQRFMFIEKVKFTSPDKVELIGLKASVPTDQLAQKFGLWGAKA